MFRVRIIKALTIRPRMTPIAAETRAYAVPSNVNIWTRCFLLSPIALAIPISVEREEARSTITRKISNNPTIIEKEPTYTFFPIFAEGSIIAAVEILWVIISLSYPQQKPSIQLLQQLYHLLLLSH